MDADYVTTVSHSSRRWLTNFVAPEMGFDSGNGRSLVPLENHKYRYSFRGWTFHKDPKREPLKFDEGGLRLWTHMMRLPKVRTLFENAKTNKKGSTGDTWFVARRIHRIKKTTMCEAELGVSAGFCSSCCCSEGLATVAFVTRLSAPSAEKGLNIHMACASWFAAVDMTFRTSVQAFRIFGTGAMLQNCAMA